MCQVKSFTFICQFICLLTFCDKKTPMNTQEITNDLHLKFLSMPSVRELPLPVSLALPTPPVWRGSSRSWWRGGCSQSAAAVQTPWRTLLPAGSSSGHFWPCCGWAPEGVRGEMSTRLHRSKNQQCLTHAFDNRASKESTLLPWGRPCTSESSPAVVGGWRWCCVPGGLQGLHWLALYPCTPTM